MRPSPMLVLVLVLASYFFVTAGIAYDIINEPPAVGATTDPVTGEPERSLLGKREGGGQLRSKPHTGLSAQRAAGVVKPMTFMPYRMNGQFILEGLSGGFFYTLGGGCSPAPIAARAGQGKGPSSPLGGVAHTGQPRWEAAAF